MIVSARVFGVRLPVAAIPCRPTRQLPTSPTSSWLTPTMMARFLKPNSRMPASSASCKVLRIARCLNHRRVSARELPKLEGRPSGRPSFIKKTLPPSLPKMDPICIRSQVMMGRRKCELRRSTALAWRLCTFWRRDKTLALKSRSARFLAMP